MAHRVGSVVGSVHGSAPAQAADARGFWGDVLPGGADVLPALPVVASRTRGQRIRPARPIEQRAWNAGLM
eukprot:2439359-Prymnesium_polylepis.1